MFTQERRLQPVDQIQAQVAGDALVDAGGIGEAVAQDPRAAVECRQDRAVQMVLARGQEQIDLGQGRQRSTGPWTISSRIASAPSVPPGSRVSRQSMPRPRKAADQTTGAACSCPPPRPPRW